jgi:CDP-diacylglycerol--serine O-phosphatidyltransferase
MDYEDLDRSSAEAPRRVFPRHRLRRGVYLLSSAFTVANLLCGYYAIMATLEGGVADFDGAAIAIGVAWIFDSVDGRVARAMGTESAFGREFDSLADVISFGIAPAVLAYAWGIRAMAAANSPEEWHLMQWGWVVGFLYLGCCAWRLARFNIQGMAPGSNRFFVGLPTPAAAGTIAATVHFFKNPITDPRFSVLWLLWIVALGALMSSTVRHYSFKDIQWTRRRPSLAVVLIVVLIAAVVKFSGPTLLLLSGVYALHGVVTHFGRVLRHRVASRHA